MKSMCNVYDAVYKMAAIKERNKEAVVTRSVLDIPPFCSVQDPDQGPGSISNPDPGRA